MKKILLLLFCVFTALFADAQCTVGAITGINHTCTVGGASTLSDTSTGGIWSSSDPSIANVDASGNVYGASVGVATITYSLTGTCAGSFATIAFTTSSGPSAGRIVGIPSGTSYCPGDTFRVSTVGTTSGITGIWSLDPLPGSIDSTGFIRIDSVQPAFASIDIHYDVTDSLGCRDFSILSPAFGVKPSYPSRPDTIIGLSYLNIGDTTTFTTNVTVPFYSFWSGGAPSVFSIDPYTGFVTAFAPGAVNVIYSIDNGCTPPEYAYFNFTVGMPSTAPSTYSFASLIADSCAGSQLYVRMNPHSPDFTLKTFYGDGSMDTTHFYPSPSDTVYYNYSHSYAYSGAYSVKQVLYNGVTPVDSLTTTFAESACSDVLLSFYLDANGNCRYDTSTEHLNRTPVRIIVDSNGVAVDTLAATSGLYYRATGVTGDVYSFSIFPADTALHFLCGSSGVFYDTLGAGTTVHYYAGLSCSGGTTFDLAEGSYQASGRHSGYGVISASNLQCMPQSGLVTLHISPKYIFDTATTTWNTTPPTSISGNDITWNVGSLSAATGDVRITYRLNIPTSTWLTVGDTVHSYITITPTAGDIDSTNNTTIRIDTVNGSYDPNNMAVTPNGDILNGTKLHYAIEFENDGNDTAKNVYVMDTLSANVDPGTIQIVSASATMNTTLIRTGGLNIMKFDFPNINLLDSSHHGQCTGIVMYTVKARTGLASGTHIYSNSGIYFDDNDVVPTNTTTNTIVIPQVSIAASPNDSVCGPTVRHFTATPTTVNTPHYQWYINSVTAGTDSTGLTATVAAGDVVRCVMVTVMDDSDRANSNSITMISGGSAPSAGAISGTTNVCVSDSITLSETVTGGSWSVLHGHASAHAGIVTGISFGVDTVAYTVTGVCGTAQAIYPITIGTSPTIAGITGTPTLCVGGSSTFTDVTTAGTWSVSDTSLAHMAFGVLMASATGSDTVLYSVTNACGTAVARRAVMIFNTPVAGTLSGPGSVCVGDTISFSATISGGIWTMSNSALATVSGGIVHGVAAGADNVVYSVSNVCGTSFATASITVSAAPDAGTLSGATSVCVGDTVSYSPSVSGGAWSMSNTSLATISGGAVRGVAAGVDTVLYTVTNFCGSSIASTTINVIAAPTGGTLSGASSVCAGNAIVFSPSVSGGAWSLSNATLASVASGVVRGISAGSDTVIYTLTDACGTAVTRSAFMVNPLPASGSLTGASRVCATDTITYSSTIPGGTWSMGDTTLATISGGVVHGVAAGTDTVLYTVTNVCGSSVARAAITINPLPVSGAVSGATRVCVGDSVVDSVTVTGGAWSLSNTSLATISGGLVHGVAAGVDTVLYTVTNICGTSVSRSAITINPLPTSGTLSGAAMVCVGDSILDSSTVSGGAWSLSNTTLATISGGRVHGVAAGMDTVIYTVTNVCGASVARAAITVNPLPVNGTLSGASTVCAGDSTLFTATATGGAWSVSNSTIGHVAAGEFTGLAAGMDSVLYAISNVCGSVTVGLPITVNPQPNAGTISGADTVCENDTTTLLSTVTGGTWVSANTAIATVTTAGKVTGVGVGSAVISYSVTNPCGTAWATHSIQVSNAGRCHVGVPQVLYSDAVALYPNPNLGMFTIAVPNDVAEASIAVLDASGRTVRTFAVSSAGATEIPVSLGTIASGVYMIKINLDGAVYFRKIVVTE